MWSASGCDTGGVRNGTSVKLIRGLSNRSRSERTTLKAAVATRVGVATGFSAVLNGTFRNRSRSERTTLKTARRVGGPH
jgi:hypothetical protein